MVTGGWTAAPTSLRRTPASSLMRRSSFPYSNLITAECTDSAESVSSPARNRLILGWDQEAGPPILPRRAVEAPPELRPAQEEAPLRRQLGLGVVPGEPHR